MHFYSAHRCCVDASVLLLKYFIFMTDIKSLHCTDAIRYRTQIPGLLCVAFRAPESHFYDAYILKDLKYHFF